MRPQNRGSVIFCKRFLGIVVLIVFGALAACTVSTPPASPALSLAVPSATQFATLPETRVPIQSATATPTGRVPAFLSATPTVVTPSPTPTETPAVIWVDNQNLVAVLPGNHRGLIHSPWSPVVDELFFLSYFSTDQESIQVAKSPDFQPTLLTVVLRTDDLIWTPDGQGVMCSCQIPGPQSVPSLFFIDQNGDQIVFQAGGIIHSLWFSDWMDAQRLVCEDYAGGGHIGVRILNKVTGQFETWGAFLRGEVNPSHYGYIPASTDQGVFDTQVLVIAAQYPFYGLPFDPLLGGNVRLLPDFEGRRWPDAISRFVDWRATSDQMLIYWGYVDQDTPVYHLLVWDVAQNTLGLLAPNGMGGEFSPDGRLLAYLTAGPALLNESSHPVSYPLGAERQPGVYLQVMELAGGTVQLSLPTYSRTDNDDLILGAHSYLRGGFSPDSRYLSFLTPGSLQLDISGWPVGVDASQPGQVYLNILDWPARKVVWSGLSNQAAGIEWSPLSDHLLYTDQDHNWQLLDVQSGMTTQMTAQVSGQFSVDWSASGRYVSLSGGEQIHIFDITHGILPR